jgi:RNA polymerase primary sigma factor
VPVISQPPLPDLVATIGIGGGRDITRRWTVRWNPWGPAAARDPPGDRARGRYELLGQEPSDAELAEELDMPVEKVQRLKDAAQAITSLDAPIGDDGAALQDLVEDEAAVGPDELAVEAVGREALEQVLAALPERQRQVLILRFGLDAGTPRTLEEVGAVMGIPREWARHLERATLAVLRRPEIRARLEDLAS